MKLLDHSSNEVISTALRGIRNLVVTRDIYQQAFAKHQMSRILSYVHPAIPNATVYIVETYACFIQSGVHAGGENRCHRMLRRLLEDEEVKPNMSTSERMFCAKILSLFDAKMDQKDELTRLREENSVRKMQNVQKNTIN